MAYAHNQQVQEEQQSSPPSQQQLLLKREKPDEVDDTDDTDTRTGTPIRYVPLHHVYSATSPCVTASGSKKVKARKLFPMDVLDQKLPFQKPLITKFYSRRAKKPRHSPEKPLLLDSPVESGLKRPIEDEHCELDGKKEGKKGDDCKVERFLEKKKRRIGSCELVKLGVDSSVLRNLDGPRLREIRYNQAYCGNSRTRNGNCTQNLQKGASGSGSAKRWVRLKFDEADPKKFIKLQCKVYWPLDDDWYSGSVIGYDPETKRHHVEYEDGDKEHLFLSNENIKFLVSPNDVHRLNLCYGVKCMDTNGLNYDEMIALAASLDDCQELEPGDIIWAKLTGHAMWPAIVLSESCISEHEGLNRVPGGRSISVQFFGTHDFARVKSTQVTSFLSGLISSFHLKCKKPPFVRSLEEAKMYLSEQKLPHRMIQPRNGIDIDVSELTSGDDERSTDSGEDCEGDERKQRTLEGLKTPPFEIGDLQVISLGKIVKDSNYFQDGRFFFPEGYTAVRKFNSITDPSACTLYKMEVLRDAESKIRPLFRVTLDNGEQFKGSTPSACWNKIYKRIKNMQNNTSDGSSGDGGTEIVYKSGSDMFGFSNPEVFKLVQELSYSRLTSKISMCKLSSKRFRDLPVGYRPVRVNWKDLDKCSVCHMDEEYENNLFLQCDKCRMMVHARCYGELEPVNGVLWLCNLCRPGAPDSTPPCCLCPVIGGAMKPTTDGRWAHLACAIWIPETCLSDVKRMEPIDGLNRINKDRWKLLCSICHVSYGACIQCSNSICRVAYHPLCARAADLCVELEDEDRLHLISVDEDEENQCIRLLSFCNKHRQPSNDRSTADEQIGQMAGQCSNYTPPSNPSGCARSEPYNYFGRRGRKEPEALAAASLKRLFVENQPYLVSGYCQHDIFGNSSSSNALEGSKSPLSLQKLKSFQLDAPQSILSMAEKYKYMRDTFRKRLAFGKSRIHGFGIFAKHPHKAGDMVIEYTGEVVRPSVADRREHFIYNSLVGAGTYMFRINDERVIDATRAGSIAHLINHSCEPNCYSRVISVNGDEHIIIFAKRDIRRWEELTYDYRFFSIDEQLACYCGFPRCRGVVNDIDAEEQVAKLHVPRSELIDWRGE